MKSYRITQWNDTHETHESRKLQFMPWVAIPTKHDGLGFSHLRADENRVELYCAWSLMVQLASKARRDMRGWLIRGNRPLTTSDMAMMTGFPETIFQKAIKFFSRPEIAWLALSDAPQTPAESPAPPAQSAGGPAESPAPPAQSPGVRQSPAAILPTDRQTDRQTDSTERERRGGPSPEEIAASRTQAGALLAGIKALESRKPDLDAAERAELRQKKIALANLQKKQAAGDFSISKP